MVRKASRFSLRNKINGLGRAFRGKQCKTVKNTVYADQSHGNGTI